MEKEQQQPTVQTSINSWTEKFNGQNWARCPACSEEYLRLRPCTFLDDNKKAAVTYLCVKCAETLVAWDWLMFTMPLPTPFLSHVKWMGPRHRYLDGKKEMEIDTPQNAYVIVEVANTDLIARSTGTGTPIRYKMRGKEEVHSADNVYQFRSKLLHTIPY